VRPRICGRSWSRSKHGSPARLRRSSRCSASSRRRSTRREPEPGRRVDSLQAVRVFARLFRVVWGIEVDRAAPGARSRGRGFGRVRRRPVVRRYLGDRRAGRVEEPAGRDVPGRRGRRDGDGVRGRTHLRLPRAQADDPRRLGDDGADLVALAPADVGGAYTGAFGSTASIGFAPGPFIAFQLADARGDDAAGVFFAAVSLLAAASGAAAVRASLGRRADEPLPSVGA
jgi:hypothetical protein